uniref:Titin-like n=1 Tax=Angiostrongylus cantonensis TaxID=6313 RepID=A0A0K0DRC9_ANGCA
MEVRRTFQENETAANRSTLPERTSERIDSCLSEFEFIKQEEIFRLEINLLTSKFATCHSTMDYQIRKKTLEAEVKGNETSQKEEMLEQIVLQKGEEIKEVEISKPVPTIQPKEELDVSVRRDEAEKKQEVLVEEIAEEKTVTTEFEFVKKAELSGLEIDLLMTEFDTCHYTVSHPIRKVTQETEMKADETSQKGEILEQIELQKGEEIKEVEISKPVPTIQPKEELDVSVRPDEAEKKQEVLVEEIAEEKTVTTEFEFVKKAELSGLEIDLLMNDFDTCHSTVSHPIRKVTQETEMKADETSQKGEILEEI